MIFGQNLLGLVVSSVMTIPRLLIFAKNLSCCHGKGDSSVWTSYFMPFHWLLKRIESFLQLLPLLIVD